MSSRLVWILAVLILMPNLVLAARLPSVGGDSGDWGSVLNEFLQISHDADGTIRNSSVDTDALSDLSVTDAKISEVSWSKVADAPALFNSSDFYSLFPSAFDNELKYKFTASGMFLVGTGNNTYEAKIASQARESLELGNMALQDTTGVGISGGTINGVVIGSSDPKPATFTTIRLPAQSAPVCDAGAAGTIYFGTDNHFYGCDGTGWKQLDN